MNYQQIKDDNTLLYGTAVKDYGRKLLVERYAQRQHFLLELLQNAEDAIKRRGVEGPRSVRFELTRSGVTLRHFGLPFSEADVRGICGIASGTKGDDGRTIGRFGIGFKAVYAFTECPEIHSGDESFAIENYVHPVAIERASLKPGETIIHLPFKPGDGKAFADVSVGLQQLGARTLLFLQEINEIQWAIDGLGGGNYMRGPPVAAGSQSTWISLIGIDEKGEETDETWLMLRSVASSPREEAQGAVASAFLISVDKEGQTFIQRLPNAPLVVFFPTVISTGLGFLLHAPFETTPSRDNVLMDEPLNQSLVDDAAALLRIALGELRELGLLTIQALSILPLELDDTATGKFLQPIFEAAKDAVATQALVPTEDGGHTSSSALRIARSQLLRQLLTPTQLKQLFGRDLPTHWVHADLSTDRAGSVWKYLTEVHAVPVITPESFARMLGEAFLAAQENEWFNSLYELLNDQPALMRPSSPLMDKPILKLADGRLVSVRSISRFPVFLPSATPTGFASISPAACASEDALAFLKRMGLDLPDLVDDIVANLVPKYRAEVIEVHDDEYAADIDRLVKAWRTDSEAQRRKLREALGTASIVMAIDMESGKNDTVARPGQVYIASERLQALFQGVPGVLVVDSSYDCLRGEPIRAVLLSCGASRYLRTQRFEDSFSMEDKSEMRRLAGQADKSGSDSVEDWDIDGLDELLQHLGRLDFESARERAQMLWEELTDLVTARGPSVLCGTYQWSYVRQRQHFFAARFVRTLNSVAWIPFKGALNRPGDVVFEELGEGWAPDLALLEQIKFRPSAIATLAQMAGFEPAVLDLLKQAGLADEVSLREALQKLGLSPEASQVKARADSNPSSSDEMSAGDDDSGEPGHGSAGGGSTANADGFDRSEAQSDFSGGRSGSGEEPGGSGRSSGSRGTSSSTGKKPVPPAGKRTFVSYVAVEPNKGDADADSLTYQQRMQLEAQALDFILRSEPNLQRTPPNNPGFDLFEVDDIDRVVRRVEVKAMRGTLKDRPVAVSRSQFLFALNSPVDHWLYVVERAGHEGEQNLIRIKDPAGNAKYFTFDEGWADLSNSGDLESMD